MWLNLEMTMDDFFIDPMAYVPGAPLDASQMGYGASLAIQQGVELAQWATEEDDSREFWEEQFALYGIK